MGDYFPEQLVRDLEMSSAMFAAKNMSAGIPLSTSFIDDKGRLRASLFPYRRASSPGLHSGSAHVPSLGPVEERESMVSFLNQRGTHEDTTDGDSFADTEASGGMIAPSIPFREQSVVTAATSLVSGGNIPSPTGSLPCDKSRIYSWIEGDSDMEDLDFTAEDKTGFLSPRPPTPPVSDNSVGSVMKTAVVHHRPRREKGSLHRRSQSLATDLPLKPQRRLSGRSATAKLQSTPPLRSSDFHHSTTTFGGQGWASRQPSPPAHAVMETPLPSMLDLGPMTSLPSLVPAASPHLDYDSDSEEEPIRAATGRAPKNEVYIRPSPPPSPPPTVQHVLNGSTQAFTSSVTLDDGPRALPLPPDVVETLRVSVVCFPETMLLTSSLTLETIRTNAKRVRLPQNGGKGPFSSTSSPRQTTGRSIWRKVSSYRRGGRWSRDDAGDMDVTPEPPKPWMAMKNIFGGASDYICDALYAHIVAYNYICALLPAQAPISVTPSSPTLSTNDEIPKKAASLLGLSQKEAVSDRPGTSRDARPHTSWRRSGRPTSNTASPVPESTLRDVQSGLTRCIMGLVATARTMAEEDGKGVGRGVLLEGRAGDEYLMRSLVEVVRLNEEAC
ncbi:hypothetical protein LIA77_10580 [Sarocladium implicatum]|nr:hypothetical protein LIA77_10580 [Sarocladium implicatum]